MAKVRFLETRQVQDTTKRVFEKGKIYELRDDSAAHFVSRNVAEYVVEAEPDITEVQTERVEGSSKETKRPRKQKAEIKDETVESEPSDSAEVNEEPAPPQE
jgi:uncharacterized protein YdcH (DUF465 family)